MKSAEFGYERPHSVSEALALKRKWGGAGRFLAGGQSLMPAMNMRFNASECLIDLNRIDNLRQISLAGDRLVIGAMARHAEVLASPLVAQHAPVLIQAGRHLAHAAIRNRGTFGGSIALADPAAEWPAACLLLNADIHVQTDAGEKKFASRDFFRGLYTTALTEDDLVTAVSIPIAAAGERSVVLELARRHGDFAVAAVMARAQVKAGQLSGLGLVFFGVADRPLRIAALEEQLQSKANAGQLDQIESTAKAALAGVSFAADLVHSVDAKRHLCGVLAQRAMTQLLESI